MDARPVLPGLCSHLSKREESEFRPVSQPRSLYSYRSRLLPLLEPDHLHTSKSWLGGVTALIGSQTAPLRVASGPRDTISTRTLAAQLGSVCVSFPF